jgi:hypothetical protein
VLFSFDTSAEGYTLLQIIERYKDPRMPASSAGKRHPYFEFP